MGVYCRSGEELAGTEKGGGIGKGERKRAPWRDEKTARLCQAAKKKVFAGEINNLPKRSWRLNLHCTAQCREAVTTRSS